MRKMLVILILVLASGTAWAEYGQWEDLYGLEPPGYSNASFLGISVADYDHLYTVGMQQPSFDEIDYGWVSSDGGLTWDATVAMKYDGSMCDMMKMYTFIIAVESAGSDVGLYGGFGTSEECYENLPEPLCMFVCMLTLSPVIYVTQDGGQTVEQATLPFAFGKAITAFDFAPGDVLFAVGGDDLIMRSYDFGWTWENVPQMPPGPNSYGDVDFPSEMVGFITSGEAEPEPERTPDMTEEEWSWALYRHRVNEVRWLRDPQFRAERRAYFAEHGGAPKGINGRIFKTTDGGNSWTRIKFSENEAFGQIEMLNEQEGWVWSTPVDGSYPDFRLYKTTDGGETWTDYTDRIPLDDLGGLAFGIMSFSFSPSGSTGFIGGVGQGVLNYKSIIFYSIDRGETWHLDETLLDWGHPVVAFDWVDDNVAYQAGGDLSVYRYTQQNVPPIADAGDDQEGETGMTITLDGSGSYDPDGDAITFAWEQVDGPPTTLSDVENVAPSFLAAEAGEYTFQLVVSDGQESGEDEVTITITNTPADDDVVDDDADDDDQADDDDDQIMADDDDDDSGCGC